MGNQAQKLQYAPVNSSHFIPPSLATSKDQQAIKPPRAKVVPSVPSQNGKVTVSGGKLLSKLLQTNPGVFIGDSHTEFNCAEFVAARMGDFKKEGVTLFFMEMFGSDAQPMLDRYFKKGDNGTELVQYLKDRGWNKRPGMAQKYFEAVQAARENGIQVIGIDNDAAGDRRLEESNPHWTEVINKHTSKKKTKYVVFGGHGHSANYSANKGVDYRLGIPSVDLVTGDPQIKIGDGKKNDFEIALAPSPDQSLPHEQAGDSIDLSELSGVVKFDKNADSSQKVPPIFSYKF
ncbi:ChaN family lipoprotein [Candidatus Margulisiibacteriota bacterium]